MKTKIVTIVLGSSWIREGKLHEPGEVVEVSSQELESIKGKVSYTEKEPEAVEPAKKKNT